MPTLKIIYDLDDFRSLRQDWQGLEAKTTEPCFFFSYAWCGQIAEMMSRNHASFYTPLIAVVTQDDQVTGLWPLSLQKSMGQNSLCGLDAPFGQMTGLLADSQETANSLVRLTIDHMQQEKTAGLLFLEHVVIGSILHTALLQTGIIRKDSPPPINTDAPTIDIAPFTDFDSFQKSRKKKTRRNWRTEHNRLERAGKIESVVLKKGEEKYHFMDRTIQNKQKWLDKEGLTAPVFRLEGHSDILIGGKEWGLQDLSIGFDLLLDGYSIAQQWGFIHKKCYYAYLSARDDSFAHLAPGSIHLPYVIEAVIGEDVDRIELLTPASPYKAKWADEIRQMVNVRMNLTRSGQLKSLLWDSTLRPVVKGVFYALPPALRQRLIGAQK